MKKGFFKSFAAVVMAITMAFSVTTLASATTTEKTHEGSRGIFAISGDGDVLDTLIKVSVPTSLAFPIDPSESSTSMFKMYNLTDKPVLVSFDLKVQTAEDVDLLDEADDLGNVLFGDSYNPTSATPGGAQVKGAVFGILTATKATVGGIGMAASPGAIKPGAVAASNAEFLFPATVGAVPAAFVIATPGDTASATARATKGDLVADFLLGKANADPASIGGLAGIAAFKLTGAYTAGDEWEAGDISVSGTYSFTVSSASNYTLLTAGALRTRYVGLNMVDLTSVERPTPPSTGGGGSVSADVYFSSAGNETLSVGSKTSFKVALSAKPATVTLRGSTSNYVENTDYTYNAATGLITVTKIQGSKPYNLTITAGGATYVVNVTN
jgi:hypothetical protein